MSERLRILGAFVGGIALGAGLVYLAPAAPPAGGGPGAPIGAPGGGGPEGTPLGPPNGAVGPPLPLDPEGGPPPAAAGALTPGALTPGAAPPGAGTPGAAPPGAAGEGPAAPADGGPKGPPPGADGGPKGPPLSGDTPPADALPAGLAADWLEQHLAGAAAFWTARAQAAAGPEAPFADRMRGLAARVPQGSNGLPPPLPEVAMLLAEELSLYDDLAAAGVDLAPYREALEGPLAFRGR